jgi:hypothetical protein
MRDGRTHHRLRRPSTLGTGPPAERRSCSASVKAPLKHRTPTLALAHTQQCRSVDWSLAHLPPPLPHALPLVSCLMSCATKSTAPVVRLAVLASASAPANAYQIPTPRLATRSAYSAAPVCGAKPLVYCSAGLRVSGLCTVGHVFMFRVNLVEYY